MKVHTGAIVLAICAIARSGQPQVVTQGELKYKFTDVSVSSSPAGTVATARVTPVPPDGHKLSAAVFAPTGGTSLGQVNVLGGRYALMMDAAGTYFVFEDLKADLGKGGSVGPLIIHELTKNELIKGDIRLVLKHEFPSGEKFPLGGRLAFALVTEHKGKDGQPRFTIVSNSVSAKSK